MPSDELPLRRSAIEGPGRAGRPAMIPREILKKIRQIELRTNRIVTDVAIGAGGCATRRAEAEEETSETIVQKIFDELPVP